MSASRRRMLLGGVVGLTLGLLDGLSAWFAPEARPMLAAIIISASFKGLVTGLAVAAIMPRLTTGWHIVAGGGLIGLVLSTLAAIPGSYIDIVIPGVIVGLLVGAILAKWAR